MHLAEINIARMREPLDTETMKEFREFLAPVNALGESSPGFVWRYEEGAAAQERSAAPPFGDNLIVINMSVWEDAASLRAFMYQTVHSYFLRKRSRWFTKLDHPHLACWWVEEGHRPTIAEAKRRLDRLAREGESEAVFTLNGKFAP